MSRPDRSQRSIPDLLWQVALEAVRPMGEIRTPPRPLCAACLSLWRSAARSRVRPLLALRPTLQPAGCVRDPLDLTCH